ncbi:unnamed protein product, partial [Lymnaea stagnalis]
MNVLIGDGHNKATTITSTDDLEATIQTYKDLIKPYEIFRISSETALFLFHTTPGLSVDKQVSAPVYDIQVLSEVHFNKEYDKKTYILVPIGATVQVETCQDLQTTLSTSTPGSPSTPESVSTPGSPSTPESTPGSPSTPAHQRALQGHQAHQVHLALL